MQKSYSVEEAMLLINENRVQKNKDVESVIQNLRAGGNFWKRIISEKDKSCARRPEKCEKNNNRYSRLL